MSEKITIKLSERYKDRWAKMVVVAQRVKHDLSNKEKVKLQDYVTVVNDVGLSNEFADPLHKHDFVLLENIAILLRRHFLKQDNAYYNLNFYENINS